MASVQPGSVRNRLLTALPAPILQHLLPCLRRVEMVLRTTLLSPNEPVATVHFPESGWVSLLVALDDGALAEVGLVGAEGLVGLNAVFGAGSSSMTGLVQATGTALALDATALAMAMDEVPVLRKLLMRYALTFNTQVTMTAACNARHPLSKRLARWLLMSDDRARGDEFAATHDGLSLVLGVRRAGISVAAAALRSAGLIRYRQGHVRVVDRPGLEQVSCGCHHVVQGEYDRLLQPIGD